ncbi:helix-turn-helix transcriptional regulator [Gordonia sp. ABSL1-1]|uniref:helix-turn-helix transcriptional regulator n=1 Tax=Gordonia sp. ABSL1-1 TaxID=3053923 RepID=UPI002572C9DE|nr:helix-turn-helix transcriptional regulator [Gordonia sp. ABSL1-1]MDL9936429.1 helix-turn-helix transcriptional regulator [Gordonia sp. ABSL1-1]
MTAIAHPIPSFGRISDARRRAEAAARRQEALARLAARRMPLPGQPVASAQSPRMVLVADPAEADPVEIEPERPVLPKPNLTSREIEVLRTWMLVDSKPAVAQQLFISLGTVNTHLTRIRAKYTEIGRPAPTKASLVARAVQDGIMTLDEL